MKDEGKKSFTIKRSGWSSFSIIGAVIFGLLLPALLLTHVFSDYATYVAGYAAYAEKTIEQNITSNEDSIAELEAKIAAANQTVAKNQTAIKDTNAQISVLEREIETKKAAKTTSVSTVEAKQTVLDRLNEEIAALEMEKAVLENTKQALQTDLERLNSELDNQNASLQAAQETVKNAEIAVLQAKKSVLEQKLNGLDKYEVDAQESLLSTIEVLNEEISALRTKIITAYNAHDENSAQSKALEEEMKPNQTAVKEVQAELEKVNATIAKHQAIADECNEKIATEQTAIKDIKTQIEKAKPYIGDLAISLTDTTFQINALQSEKEQLDPVANADKIAKIEEELTLLQASFTELQAQYEVAYQTRKAQERQISEHETKVKAETVKRDEALAIIQQHLDENVTPLTEKKTQLQATIDGYQAKIDKLSSANDALLKEINSDKNTIDEKQAQITSYNKIIEGLSPTVDASEITALQEEITAIDEQLKKWENNALQVNTVPVAGYTGDTLTLKAQAYKQAVESLNETKKVLQEEISKKAKQEKEIAVLNSALTSNTTDLQQKQSIISTKTNDKNNTKTIINTEQNKILGYEQEIETLNNDKANKADAIVSLTTENNTQETNVLTWNSSKENFNGRVTALKKLFETKSTAILHTKEIAIITAFEKDSLSTDAPYQADAKNAGLLTTTKILYEKMHFDISQIEMLTYIFAILSVALFLSTLIVVLYKLRKAKRTQYVVTENVIQYPPNSTPALRFILEQGATVEMKQSFKGLIFGYGTLTISQGTGYAGKCKILHVKSIRNAKRLLQEQIKRYGKFVKTV